MIIMATQHYSLLLQKCKSSHSLHFSYYRTVQVMVSMNLALLVGLSVDYVVHLAEAYHRSPHRDRLGRTRDMLEHLGVSVLSGAVTTLGASFFMLFAQIQFFVQFGTCLMATIGFSLFFSLGLYATAMALIGPQGDTGSLAYVYRAARRRATGRRADDVDCPRCDGKGFVAAAVVAGSDDDERSDAERQSQTGSTSSAERDDSEAGCCETGDGMTSRKLTDNSTTPNASAASEESSDKIESLTDSEASTGEVLAMQL